MKNNTNITICLGSSCYRRGNQAVLEIIKAYLKENNLKDKVDFKGHLCTGNCLNGPNLKINEEKYFGVSQDSVIEILDKYFNSK
ncbi:MAG: NAD(P)H-dependent oxidoreductase subunit E [Bacteroidota bacterium]|nr:NAD(P)H-dependent oxidoreductase subunit E [Bacteroidota bacterium]